MFSYAAHEKMAEAAATMRSHDDQIYLELMGHAHNVNIWIATAYFDPVLDVRSQILLGDRSELCPSFPLPSWILCDRHGDIHILVWYSCDVSEVESGVTFFAQLGSEEKRRDRNLIELKGAKDFLIIKHAWVGSRSLLRWA